MDMKNSFKFKDKYNVYDLVEILKVLRSEGGCPWDIKQTHESIKKNLIEETYEAIEAINKKDPDMLREELGDVLFSAVNVSRFVDTDAEESLTDATDKFVSRFKTVEKLAKERDIDMKESDIETLDRLWDEAKH